MSRVIPAPGPSEPFTLETLDPQIWYHVFCTETRANNAHTFNPGRGQSRFAPIQNASGQDVHTCYAANTIRSAMMESVLHVPVADQSAGHHASALGRMHACRTERRHAVCYQM